MIRDWHQPAPPPFLAAVRMTTRAAALSLKIGSVLGLPSGRETLAEEPIPQVRPRRRGLPGNSANADLG